MGARSFILGFVLACAPAFSADFADYSRRIWRSEDGLPQNKIQVITQTPEGYLWIGTSGGLVRFDGVHFAVFDRLNTPALLDDSILSLWPTSDGELWIGTEGGGLVLMKDGNFQSYASAEGLTNGFVRAVLQDRGGRVWVGTDRGFFRFDRGRLIRLDARNDIPILSVRTIYEDRGGTVWVSTYRGLYTMQGDQPVRSSGEYANSADVNGMVETADGVLWVASNSGAHPLNRAAGDFSNRAGPPGARNMVQDREGNLWIGTFAQGLVRYSHGQTTNYKAAEMLPDNTILALYEDREGNIWVGTQDGLVRLTRREVQTLSSSDGLASDDVATIYEDPSGVLWIGTVTGELYRRDGNKLIPFHPPAVARDFHPRNIYVDREGGQWLGSAAQGVLHLHSGKTDAISTSNGLRSNQIRDFLEDRDGNVWIATGSGLSRWDGHGVRTYYIEDGLAYGGMHALELDRNGDLLVGTDGGLNRVHEGRFVKDPVFAKLGNERIWSMMLDSRQSLWLGTRGDGLIRIRDGKITHYTKRDGLPSNSIYQILEDRNGHLWMSSSAGIFWVGRSELDALAGGRVGPMAVAPFGMDDGLLTTQMSGGTQPPGCITRSGDLWFPSVRGAVHIEPQKLRHSVPAPVLIESVVIDGQPVPLSSNVSIPPGRGKLEIAFTSPNLLSPDRVTFKYKLESFDDTWTAASHGRRAYYTNLPPGKYRFRVMARSGTVPDRTSEAALGLTLQPYFYQTGWFFTALVLALGLTAWLILRFYARQTKARYALVLAERTRLAREMHDTVIQGCVGVSTLLEAARSMPVSAAGKVQELLERASMQVRLTIDEAREAVWDLRHSTLDHNLNDTLRDFARQVAASEGIPVRAQIEGTPSPLDDLADRNLLLVAREAIRNAVTHAHPGEINVKLKYEHAEVSLEVSDDGRGFTHQTARENGHYGIVGMKERVEQSGGTFEVISGPGQGTRVTARVPIKMNGKH